MTDPSWTDPSWTDPSGADRSGTELSRFLRVLGHDFKLQALVRACVTADEVAVIAQQFGFAVTGDQLLLCSGRYEHGVTITRVDQPGEYPGRYY
jgi:hypothetical protein